MNPEYIQVYHENRLGITFFEYVLLVLVHQRLNDTLLRCYEDNEYDFMYKIKVLEEQGYVKWHGDKMDEISLRKKAEDLFKQIKTKQVDSEITIWIESWRDIFPEGLNSAGFRYRGNRSEVIKKMIKFVSSHSYTKEEIFEATKKYVERFSMKGYNYMQIAHYFIEKQGVGSTLESECESLKNSSSKPVESPKYGGDVR